jgi:hypothetical protein
MREDICQCEDPEPPTRKTTSVTRIGTVTCDLFDECDPGSKLSDFVTPQGVTKQKLSYAIEMLPAGASADFAVVCNRTRVGSTTLKVV